MNKEIDIDEYIYLLGQEIFIFIRTHSVDIVKIPHIFSKYLIWIICFKITCGAW